MARSTKTGSSRRKGDEYQDLTALQLALDLYIDGADFELFIEYEKAGSLDDVLIVLPNRVAGYQVKHAVNEHAVYVADDLMNSDSVVFIQKFAKSWKELRAHFLDRPLELHLRSNRGLDAQLGELIQSNGFFDKQFQKNRYRKEKGTLRKRLKEATGLSEEEFQQFIECFHFDLNRPSWRQLEQYIQAILLDHKLGVSDRRVFAELKQLVERHAIEIADPLTPQIIDSFFRDTQTRYLLPQVFPIEKERFVKSPKLAEQLDIQLHNADGEYIVITGPPGSGKSTALTEYFESLESKKSSQFSVARYYCFIRVHDNRQRLRLEAKSLRVNLLTELQRRFPHVLDARRFDYSEHRFLEALEAVSANCRDQGKKVVIFLDGLDHVERDTELRDSIIAALPDQLPSGVVIVVGTQELHNWRPLSLRKGRNERHIEMPLFSREETRVYIIDRCGLCITDAAVNQIHEKSGGLPLYLRYLAEIVADSDNPATAIESIPTAVNGDIRSYYQMLWAAFDAEGMSDAKYLSAVLCSLRFSVHEDELFGFQHGISDRPRFDSAFRRVRHLLRAEDNLVAIFHDSFRAFVLQQIDSVTKAEISGTIAARLKLEERQSLRWFKHAFRYAFDAKEYSYVLGQVNRGFVDAALLHFRDEEEIMAAIDCGIEAAAATSDLVALSRLGSLKFRTHERIEYNLPHNSLAQTLLYLGRIDQVVDSIYSQERRIFIAGAGFSLGIILVLHEVGMADLAAKLFSEFLKGFHGDGDLGKPGIIDFARSAGIFPTRVSRAVRWIAETTMRRDELEPADFETVYAPHLAAYVDGLVCAGRDRLWRRLKSVHTPFPNELTRHLIIRAVAKRRAVDLLRSEIEQFVSAHPEVTNVELGYFAAKSGMKPDVINRLAGHFHFPRERATSDSLGSQLKGELRYFAYWAVILGYQQNSEIIHQLTTRVPKTRAVWSCAQRHLLSVGEILGSHFAGRQTDWFTAAKQAIKELDALDVPGERTSDALDACRFVLPESLFWLSEAMVARCPERLDDWITELGHLRDSFIWTTHYGIGEQVNDYSFEFKVWDRQRELPKIECRLSPILERCATSYDEASALKGGLRASHFAALSGMAARCGLKAKAELWMARSIGTSLAYGYRKDITLQYLIDVATILHKHQTAKTLTRGAGILEMVKWMPVATDGRETKHFAQYIVPLVIQANRAASLELLRTYYRRFATWQADESLGKYILSRANGDAEFYWALAGILHPNSSVEEQEHIARLGEATNPHLRPTWTQRLNVFFMTMVNPRHWPDSIWNDAIQKCPRPERHRRNEESTGAKLTSQVYKFDGFNLTTADARDRCKASFASMVATIEKLKQQNEYVPDYDLIPAALPVHIATAATPEDLGDIKAFYETHALWHDARYWEQIARKYLEFGDVTTGLICLERAIHEGGIVGPLATLINYDHERARKFLVADLTDKLLGGPENGFSVPKTAATVLDALGDIADCEQVFQDYFQHCQELFSALPDEHWFDAIRDWHDHEEDENTQIIHLLIDCLGEPAAEFGERLIVTMAELLALRGESIISVIIERTLAADGLRFWRLLVLISNLASTNAAQFLEQCQPLIPLLERDSFLVRSLLSRSFKVAFEGRSMPAKIAEAIYKVDRDYSSTIHYRGFGLVQAEPSHDFLGLIKHATTFSFSRQLKAVCEILSLDRDAVTAHLERHMLKNGAILADERDAAKSLGRAYTHPQGWPMIWFIPEFHVKINNSLYQLLDEALIKNRYQLSYVEALWRVIQPFDPECCLHRPGPLPKDILPLLVPNEDEWIAKQDEKPHISIEAAIPDRWITAFEFRQLAQDTPYHTPYVVQTHVRSAIVRPEVISQISEVEAQPWGETVVTHHPAENLTWCQFREALLEGHASQPDEDDAVTSLVAYKEKHVGFLGYHTLASFSSKVIRKFSLVFNGFDVFDGNDRVGHFEVWQEGYPDEDYNDQPLSFGVRFRVSRSFIQKICHNSSNAFAVRTVENRFIMKDYEREPAQSSHSTTIRIWPMP